MDGVDPNDVEGGTAVDEPVQLPNITAINQSGDKFSLEQLKVLLFRIHFIGIECANRTEEPDYCTS